MKVLSKEMLKNILYTNLMYRHNWEKVLREVLTYKDYSLFTQYEKELKKSYEIQLHIQYERKNRYAML